MTTEDEFADSKTGLSLVLTPRGALDFFSGLFYGSELVQDTAMLDQCLTMLSDDFVEQAYNIYEKANELDVFLALYSFYDMTWSLHPLLLTCMEAPDTAG